MTESNDETFLSMWDKFDPGFDYNESGADDNANEGDKSKESETPLKNNKEPKRETLSVLEEKHLIRLLNAEEGFQLSTSYFAETGLKGRQITIIMLYVIAVKGRPYYSDKRGKLAGRMRYRHINDLIKMFNDADYLKSEMDVYESLKLTKDPITQWTPPISYTDLFSKEAIRATSNKSNDEDTKRQLFCYMIKEVLLRTRPNNEQTLHIYNKLANPSFPLQHLEDLVKNHGRLKAFIDKQKNSPPWEPIEIPIRNYVGMKETSVTKSAKKSAKKEKAKEKKKSQQSQSKNPYEPLSESATDDKTGSTKLPSVKEEEEQETEFEEAINVPNKFMCIDMKEVEQLPDSDCRDLYQRKISAYVYDFYQEKDAEKIISTIMELNLRKITSLLVTKSELKTFLSSHNFKHRDPIDSSPRKAFGDGPLASNKEYTYLIEVVKKNSTSDINMAVIEFCRMIFNACKDLSTEHNMQMNPVNRGDSKPTLYSIEEIENLKDSLVGTYITNVESESQYQKTGHIRLTTTLDLLFFIGSSNRRQLRDGMMLSEFLKSKSLWIKIIGHETTGRTPSCICIRSSKYDNRHQAVAELIERLNLYGRIEIEKEQMELKWERYHSISEKCSTMILHIYIDCEIEEVAREQLISRICYGDIDEREADRYPVTYDYQIYPFAEAHMREEKTAAEIIHEQTLFTDHTCSMYITGLHNRDIFNIYPLPAFESKWDVKASLGTALLKTIMFTSTKGKEFDSPFWKVQATARNMLGLTVDVNDLPFTRFLIDKGILMEFVKEFLPDSFKPDEIRFKLVNGKWSTNYHQDQFYEAEPELEQSDIERKQPESSDSSSSENTQDEDETKQVEAKTKEKDPIVPAATKGKPKVMITTEKPKVIAALDIPKEITDKSSATGTTVPISESSNSGADKSSSTSGPTKISEGMSTLTQNTDTPDGIAPLQQPQVQFGMQQATYYPPPPIMPPFQPPVQYGPYGVYNNPNVTVPTTEHSLPVPVVNTIIATMRNEAVNQFANSFDRHWNMNDPYGRLQSILYDRDQYWEARRMSDITTAVHHAFQLHKEATLPRAPTTKVRKTRSLNDLADIQDSWISRIQCPPRSAMLNPNVTSPETAVNTTQYRTPMGDNSYTGPIRNDVESALSELERQKMEFDKDTGGKISPVINQSQEESIDASYDIEELRRNLDERNAARDRNWESILSISIQSNTDNVSTLEQGAHTNVAPSDDGAQELGACAISTTATQGATESSESITESTPKPNVSVTESSNQMESPTLKSTNPESEMGDIKDPKLDEKKKEESESESSETDSSSSEDKVATKKATKSSKQVSRRSPPTTRSMKSAQESGDEAQQPSKKAGSKTKSNSNSIQSSVSSYFQKKDKI